MSIIPRFRPVVLLAILASFTLGIIAQGPPGRDRDNPPPGHGGMPPGQAKKYDRDGRGMPPGQAKKYGDFRFRGEDRDHFYAHYRHDADRWRGRRRPDFVPGRYIPRGYVVQPVPRSYWVDAAPPPPGYLYGYCGGYVVAYDPATRVVADVLDLVSAAQGR